MTNRSLRRTRCGDVYRAVRWPAARSAASTIAVTDPLPFVPAICTERNARSGCPRRVDDGADVVEPELDAELLEPEEVGERLRRLRPAH